VKLQYNGQEQVPASVDAVWAFIADPNKVGRCLPDVVELTVQDPTHFDAVVSVGLGPVRGRLRFKAEMRPDPAARRMTIKVSGGGLGSAVDQTATAELVAVGPAATTLNWSGEAEMRGPIAAVGGRVLDAQAQKLIAQTFVNVREQLTSASESL
jgi:carbon monoxide dehydrogenase subunit G